MILYKDVKVAGLTFNVFPKDIEALLEGDVLDLTAEPDNTFDPNAVMVSKDGHKFGYVPKSHNLKVARFLEAGDEVIAKVVSTKANNFLLLISIYIDIPVTRLIQD